MHLFDLTETDSREDWSYLSEGGASILLSYVGGQHPVCTGKVLRIRKTLADSTQHLSSASEDDNSLDDGDPAVDFQKIIISQLVPEHYLPDVQSVSLASEWLHKLAAAIHSFRPVVRRRESVDTSQRVAALVANLVDGGLAVEIKPKWGFLPAPAHVAHATRPFKTRHCRLCMHRYYKHSDTSQIENPFCPLDLFSGDRERIRRYLHGLCTSWLSMNGQVNNLRIFHDGKLIDSAAKLAHAKVPDIAVLVEHLLDQILETDIFNIIRGLQKTMDPLDIEGLAQLWSVSHPGLAFGDGEPEPTLGEWREFIRVYHNREEWTLRHFLLAYLLSATFKDCSVIIGLGEAQKRKISVIDVGPKSIQRLRKWKELDSNILSHFMRLSDSSGPKDPCFQ